MATPGSSFPATARERLAQAVREIPPADLALVLVDIIEDLLGQAEAWHEAYRLAGGNDTPEQYGHADGMDDAAAVVADQVAEKLWDALNE